MTLIVGMGFASLQKQGVMVILTADSVQKAHLQMKRIVVRTKVYDKVVMKYFWRFESAVVQYNVCCGCV